MSFAERMALYVVASLFSDWFLQQPEIQQVEAKYAPRIPAIVAIVLVLASFDGLLSAGGPR